MLVDKSDEETVEEETEQTSAASLAWVLDTCAEAVVELTDAEDFADACISAGPAHHARLMTGESAGESPRGVLKRVLSKLSKVATPAALESLPRLVATLCGSEYLSEVMEAVQEAYYQNHLENHERWAAGYMERTGWLIPPPLYPEEWEHWCYEIPHTIA